MATRSTTPVQKRNKKNTSGRKAQKKQIKKRYAPKSENKKSVTKWAERAKNGNPTAKDIEFYCYFSYLGPFWFIGLLSGSNNKTLRFHLNQGITLFIAELLAAAMAYFFGELLALIPFVGVYISRMLRLGVIIASCAMAIYGMIGVANGEKRKLPVIGTFKMLK